jgi:hypothetical protein
MKSDLDKSLVELEAEEDYEALQLAERRELILKSADMLRSEKGLPRPHTLMLNVPTHVFTSRLDHIERMSYQGLNAYQIAARLGVSARVFADAAERFPDVRAALEGGSARAADELSGTAMRNAVAGRDSGMIKFLLQTKHQFVAPRETPSVTVNIGALGQPPTIEHAENLAEEQTRLLALDQDRDKD